MQTALAVPAAKTRQRRSTGTAAQKNFLLPAKSGRRIRVQFCLAGHRRLGRADTRRDIGRPSQDDKVTRRRVLDDQPLVPAVAAGHSDSKHGEHR